MSNPTWALCSLEKCSKFDTCERFDKDGKMEYNMNEACLKNDFKWYIEKRIEIEKVEVEDEEINS